VLRPRASDFRNTPRVSRSVTSRNAVSGEHLAIAVHLLLVSVPSKPSSSRLISFTCRSFSGVAAQRCQNRVFGQHRVERVLRLVDGSMQRVEKPSEPLGDIKRRLLGALQDVVVRVALPLDLRRQTVEALGTSIGAGQEQVADRAGDAAIAIVERMQSDEPQVGESRVDQRRLVGNGVRPLEKSAGLGLQSIGWRSFEMHALASR